MKKKIYITHDSVVECRFALCFALTKVGAGQSRSSILGTSAGGLQALIKILPALRKNFYLPLLIVQHLHKSQDH
ncbi:MAG: chemotaxis protein CheB [Candidatus Cloacimonadota bacterium]|nr:chemotaxis protein CheB [Candidatus Cloacimonadota bacterium]